MENGRGSKVQKLAQSALRLNVGLLVILLLAFFFLSTAYWAIARVLWFEQAKAAFHFTRLVGTMQEYERFLLQFTRATEPESKPSSPGAPAGQPAELATLKTMPRGEVDIYEGQQFAFSPPFALSLPGGQWALASQAPQARERQLRLGVIADSVYSSFWSHSRFRAPQVLLFDLDSVAGMAVPSIDARPDLPVRARKGLLRVLDSAREQVRQDLPSPGVLKVHWQVDSGYFGGKEPELMAYLEDSVPDTLWWQPDAPRRVIVATVLELDALTEELGWRYTPSFDLLSPDGQALLGSRERVERYGDGVHLAASGLLIKCGSSARQGWQAVYFITYSELFRQQRWAIVALVTAFLTILGSGWALLRWYRRRVVAPASQAHYTLEESHAFNRAIIETAPVALCVLDQGGREVVIQNALAQAWLGGPEAMVSLVRDWHLIEAGRLVPGEACVVAGGLSLHARWAPAQYGGASVLLCAFNDISAHREALSALRGARAAADEANAAKSRFLATMSHEIRTPLYGVVSTLELLGLTPLDARQQGYLHTIRSSSDVLLQLISDILDVSKIEAGQMPLEAEAFDPQALTEEILRGYAARAQEKGLQFYACLDADVPQSVVGDGMRIRQVLANLVSNAIKFTGAGRVAVTLRREREADDGVVRLRWEVVDTGSGLSKAQQERLFEPFYQADNQADARLDGRGKDRPATPAPIGGTGLGLSICRRLSDLMGGTLEVVSVPGVGSQFAFTVPLAAVPRLPAQPGAAVAVAARPVCVRSPAPDLTASLCRWLVSLGWDAHALAADSVPEQAPGEGGADTGNALLLDVLPAWLAPLPWAGVRVTARHDAALRPESVAGGWQVNLHSRAGILQALAAAAGLDPGLLPAAGGDDAATQRPPLGLRVLAAEDNPINRTLLKEQLEALGCTVTVAADGEAALRCAQTGQFDVVLTDVNMPVMDGYALTRALRARGASLPILGVTANAMRDEGERCLAAGMDAWMTKPISLLTLYERLHAAAKAAGAAVAAAGTVGGAAAVGAMESVAVADGVDVADGADGADAAGAVADDALDVPAPLRQLFLSTMAEDLAATRAALAQGDAVLLRQLLHRMRGALSVARGADLVTACREQETALAEGRTLAGDAPLQALLDRIESAVGRVQGGARLC